MTRLEVISDLLEFALTEALAKVELVGRAL